MILKLYAQDSLVEKKHAENENEGQGDVQQKLVGQLGALKGGLTVRPEFAMRRPRTMMTRHLHRPRIATLITQVQPQFLLNAIIGEIGPAKILRKRIKDIKSNRYCKRKQYDPLHWQIIVNIVVSCDSHIFLVLDYSYRKALMGSVREAFNAGKKPAIRPKMAHETKEITIHSTLTT